MTDEELIEYYVNLLIMQYRDKARARATVAAQVEPVIMDQLPASVQNAFNLETAVGVQLDILGKYAGITRNALTFAGPVVLDDDDFRTMIKLKIILNNSGSSLYDIQQQLHMFFEGSFRVFDYQNMHMSYFFDSSIGSVELAEIFVRQGLLPKPMGVQLTSLVYLPSLENLFSFSTYTMLQTEGSGFNTYSDYQTDVPWLSYEDTIPI